uniref:Nucleolus and neural progenitor protein-like N-terminal domain-containing protein n=1 Tax=Schizaphis graminum TaxID=13262 RepID=A0A2S2PBE0_SCHGA
MLKCCYRINLPKPKQMKLQATISKEKLDNLHNMCKNIITNQAINDLKKLFDEGALISRMCCKVKNKFRGEKLFRRLKQITIYIKKIHQLNISEVILILLSSFDNGMPTKQACQWAGTRIIAVLSLINQLQQFSEGTAQLIVKVFQNGQCWLEMNLALAMVSRVWILSKSLHKSFSRSYEHFRPLVNQFKMSETKWLSNFELPECLNNILENSQCDSVVELVERPGSVMSRKPEPEDPIIKKRKRPGKRSRMLQEKHKNKIKVVKKQRIN